MDRCRAFSPAGTRLATVEFASSVVKIWDTTDGQKVLALTGHGRPVTAVAFNTAGTRLASASKDKTVNIWDARSGQKIFSLEHNAEVKSIIFSPDGSRLTSIGADGMVKVWDVRSGQEAPFLAGKTPRSMPGFSA
jgi:WD40 repeat protein